MAPPADLRDWIALLEREGELVRVGAEVDPRLEITEINDRVVKAGVKAILNFAPAQLHAPADVTVKTVNMAMELEGLSFALTNRD